MRIFSKQFASLSFAILYPTFLLSCGQSLPPPVTLSKIFVTPATASVPLGFSQQFTATALYSDGTSRDVTNSASWSSSDPSVAVVLNGEAASLGCQDFSVPGTANISAALNNVAGTAIFTVTGPVLLSVLPITSAVNNMLGGFVGPVQVGQAEPLYLYGSYSGSECDPSSPYFNAAANATWNSTNPGAVAVDSTGTVTGVSIGLATISANISTYNGPVTETTVLGSIGPTARYVAVTNSGSNDVSIFSISESSGLFAPNLLFTSVSGSPFAAGSQPTAVTTVPSGSLVYVANSGSNDISGFKIDLTTGGLTPVASSPFPVGSAPSAVAASSVGSFLYAANAGSNNLSGFGIDSGTGILSQLPGSPFPTGTQPSVVATVGSFLYVANAGSNNISAFTIDATTGNLLSIAGSPFASGNKPIALTIDNEGRFLYVANQGSTDVTGFVVNATTGQLQPMNIQFPTITLLCSDSILSSISVSPIGSVSVGVTNPGALTCSSNAHDVVLEIAIDSSGNPVGSWSDSVYSTYPLDSAGAVAADSSGLYIYLLNSGQQLLQTAPAYPGANFVSGTAPTTGALPSAIAIIH